MKIDAISFGNRIPRIPANHEEMENKALIEIYKRFMAGEKGPYKIDYYYGKDPIITNMEPKTKNTGIINKIKHKLKNLFK